MSDSVRVGIIICDRYHTCAGGKCLRAMRAREGAFAAYKDRDVELVGFTTCGGCPGGNIEYAPEEMKKNGAEVGAPGHGDAGRLSALPAHRGVPPLHPREVRDGGRRRHASDSAEVLPDARADRAPGRAAEWKPLLKPTLADETVPAWRTTDVQIGSQDGAPPFDAAQGGVQKAAGEHASARPAPASADHAAARRPSSARRRSPRGCPSCRRDTASRRSGRRSTATC